MIYSPDVYIESDSWLLLGLDQNGKDNEDGCQSNEGKKYGIWKKGKKEGDVIIILLVCFGRGLHVSLGSFLFFFIGLMDSVALFSNLDLPCFFFFLFNFILLCI